MATGKFDFSGLDSIKSEVAARLDAYPGMKLATFLSNDDIPRYDFLTGEQLYSQAFAATIAFLSGGTARFSMSHRQIIYGFSQMSTLFHRGQDVSDFEPIKLAFVACGLSVATLGFEFGNANFGPFYNPLILKFNLIRTEMGKGD